MIDEIDYDQYVENYMEEIDESEYDSKINGSFTEESSNELEFFKVETEKELKRIEELKKELYPSPKGATSVPSKKKYYCDICNFSSDKRQNIAVHIKLSKNHAIVNQFTGEDGVQYYYCKQCKFVSKRKDNYTSHVTYVHTDYRPWKCPTCEYAGKRKDYLDRHLKFAHTNARPNPCPKCPYAAKGPDQLKAHLQRHEQDYHFECSNCDKSFRSKESIKYHKMNVCTEAYFYKVNSDPEENILRKPSYPKKRKNAIITDGIKDEIKDEQEVSSTTPTDAPLPLPEDFEDNWKENDSQYHFEDSGKEDDSQYESNTTPIDIPWDPSDYE